MFYVILFVCQEILGGKKGAAGGLLTACCDIAASESKATLGAYKV